jgi:hypothetical protein
MLLPQPMIAGIVTNKVTTREKKSSRLRMPGPPSGRSGRSMDDRPRDCSLMSPVCKKQKARL